MEHTLTPWELAEHKPGDKWLSIHAASVEIDIDDWDEDGMQEQFANARFIVQAVNSHDELLGALVIAQGKLTEVYEADNGPVSTMPDVVHTLKTIETAILNATKEGK